MAEQARILAKMDSPLYDAVIRATTSGNDWEKIGPVYFRHGRRVQWNLLTEFKHLRLAFHALAFVSHAITWSTRQRSSQRLRNTSHFRPRVWESWSYLIRPRDLCRIVPR